MCLRAVVMGQIPLGEKDEEERWACAWILYFWGG
jgi:hypothetical protein